MDWIGLQLKIDTHHDRYFCEKQWTEAKIESARSKDIGELASNIDAVIRAIARGGSFGTLTADEEDILGIRLDWAFQTTLSHSLDPFESEENLSEDDVEMILITHWHAEGRTKYQARKSYHAVFGKPPTSQIAPCNKRRPQKGKP